MVRIKLGVVTSPAQCIGFIFNIASIAWNELGDQAVVTCALCLCGHEARNDMSQMQLLMELLRFSFVVFCFRCPSCADCGADAGVALIFIRWSFICWRRYDCELGVVFLFALACAQGWHSWAITVGISSAVPLAGHGRVAATAAAFPSKPRVWMEPCALIVGTLRTTLNVFTILL